MENYHFETTLYRGRLLVKRCVFTGSVCSRSTGDFNFLQVARGKAGVLGTAYSPLLSLLKMYNDGGIHMQYTAHSDFSIVHGHDKDLDGKCYSALGPACAERATVAPQERLHVGLCARPTSWPIR